MPEQCRHLTITIYLAEIRAGFAKLAKGAGLKILSRRSSRVRIPYPALIYPELTNIQKFGSLF